MHSTEAIVRQFFELCGFATISARKFAVKRGWADVDLLVVNAAPETGKRPLVLDVPGLRNVERAMVEVKAWFRDWGALTLANLKDVRFRDEAVQHARQLFGEREFATILIWPEVPAEVDERLAKKLQERGIEHLLGWSTIMNRLVTEAPAERDYGDSEVMQTIRLLKLFGWLRDRPLSAPKEMSLKERRRLARSAFGMWANHEEIVSSVEYVEGLRAEWETRMRERGGGR